MSRNTLFLSMASALLVVAAASANAAPPGLDCRPAAPRQVIETFLSADCDACWQAPETVPLPAKTLRLDWIVPGAKGDDAPMAVAALAEAQARLKSPLPSDAPVRQAHLSGPAPGLTLTVLSGLAFNGYVGLSFELQRRGGKPLPDDAQGWLALVERVPGGEDHSPTGRQLVRTLVGPLPLHFSPGKQTLQDLRAVLYPANAHPERLAAVGWVERADGSMLVAGQSLPKGCEPE